MGNRKQSNRTTERLPKTQQLEPNRTKMARTTYVIAVLALVAVMFSTVSAKRMMLQDAPPAPGFYPGFNAGQYFNPGWWTNLYQQVIPYDIGARWINQNTGFRVPVIGLPGVGGGGSGGTV